MFRISLISLSLIIAGCSLAPKYERPQAPIPVAYNDQRSGVPQSVNNSVADLDWQDVIRDPRLRELVRIALKNNRDLRMATQRVEEARAAYGITRADQFPHIGASASESAQHYPENMRTGGAASSAVSRVFTSGIGLTGFELDFWGKRRNLSAAAFESYLSTEEARKTVQIDLIAQVASTYFTLRANQTLANLASRTINSYQETLNLVKQRFNAGIDSALAVHQANTSLQTARASLASANRAVAQASNALDLLLGQTQPTNLPVAQPFGGDVLLENIPTGLPSDLLVRRPDIIAAEHNLKAANANIGAARAAFFPNISLTALLGSISPALSDLFGSGQRYWSFQPSISLPIFSAGALSNSLDLAEIRKNITITAYEKVIQTAFREVSDALVGETTFKEQLSAMREQQAAAYESLRLAEMRYKAGIDSFLQVQQAQISLYTVQQSFLQTGLQALKNRLELFKALGGGWSASSPAASTGSTPTISPITGGSNPNTP